MNGKNPKPVMSATSFSDTGSFPSGQYVLYASGDIDFEKLQALVSPFPNFALGPLCWLISLPDRSAQQFADSASMTLPMEDGKAELLLCYLGKKCIIHGNAGGLGLIEWLKKNGYFSP